MKNIVVHYDALIVDKKPVKQMHKLLRFIKKLNKNTVINVYVKDQNIAKESKYYLDTFKIPYNDFVQNIDVNDYFISSNTKETGDYKLAYLLAGKDDRRIKAGDVVELVSGSYPMSVETYNSTTKLANVSFIGSGSQFETIEINADALKKTDMTWQKMIELAKASSMEDGE